MKFAVRIVAVTVAVLAAATFCYSATITGVVNGPDGSPFAGAFVLAQNTKTRISVDVLSAKDGRYRVENLPAGDYDLRIRAVGYKADPHPGVTLTPDQHASVDFALQKGAVRWNEISTHQGRLLLPEARGKDLLSGRCWACHEFQSRMASVHRDEEGWRDRVNYMRETMHFFLASSNALIRLSPTKRRTTSFLTSPPTSVPIRRCRSPRRMWRGTMTPYAPLATRQCASSTWSTTCPAPAASLGMLTRPRTAASGFPSLPPSIPSRTSTLKPARCRSTACQTRLLLPSTRRWKDPTAACGSKSRPRTRLASGTRKQRRSPNTRILTFPARKVCYGWREAHRPHRQGRYPVWSTGSPFSSLRPQDWQVHSLRSGADDLWHRHR